MQRNVLLSLIGCLTLGAICHLHSQETRKPEERAAREILESALAVNGGPAKCAQLTKIYSKRAGNVSGLSDYVTEQWNELPSRSKLILNAEEAGQKGRLVLVVDGTRGWQKIDDGKVTPLNPEGVRKRHEVLYREYLLLLEPILTQQDRFTARHLGQVEVDGRAADRIQVKADGETDMDLFIDKETKRVVKLAHPVTQPVKGSLPGIKTTSLRPSNFKELNGVQIPHLVKTYADSKLIMEDNLVELRVVKEFPAETFAEPTEEPKKNAENERADAVLSKALAAHGGRDKVVLLEKCHLKYKGKTAENKGFTLEQWLEFPACCKTIFVFDNIEKNGRIEGTVVILNRGVSWVWNDVQFVREGEVELRSSRDRLHREYLRLLYPILERSGGIEATFKGEQVVKGRPTNWIQVRKRGEIDVNMHFDRESSLLTKLTQDFSDPRLGKTVSLYFSDYKNIDGLMYPGKTEAWADEKLALQMELVQLQSITEFFKDTFTPGTVKPQP